MCHIIFGGNWATRAVFLYASSSFPESSASHLIRVFSRGGLPLGEAEVSNVPSVFPLQASQTLWFPFLTWLGTLSRNYLRRDIRNNATSSGLACFSSSGSQTCRYGSVCCNAEQASNSPFASQLIAADTRLLRMIYMETVSTAVPTLQIEYKNSH